MKQLDASAVIMCIEIEQLVNKQGWHWNVICSRPGRDGTWRKEWTNPSGRLSNDQAEDLSAYVTTVAMGALVTWGGVQETFPTSR